MRTERVAIALTVLNLVLLIALLSQIRPAIAKEAAPVLRGRALEIVDDRGRTRASISIYPSGQSANGDGYSETVLLRLINGQGRPAIKISTSDEGSGMSVTSGAGTHETYVSLGSKGPNSLIKLRNEDGKERIIEP
jgi:hypothetical protein